MPVYFCTVHITVLFKLTFGSVTHNMFYGPLGFYPGLPGWADTRKVKPGK